MTHNHAKYCIDQIDGYFCDLINSDEMTGAEIAMELNKMIAEWEDYHQKQLKKVREIRTALFTSTLEIQQKDTREMLYEEIRKSDKHDLD
tara:strand:- start:323 stop:592 length:270 start_codon:yes stop_codon:yes gene_type:complete